MRKVTIADYSDDNPLRLTEEQWHRLWYDLYHNNIASCTPQPPNVVKHYSMIPTHLIIKFSEKQ